MPYICALMTRATGSSIRVAEQFMASRPSSVPTPIWLLSRRSPSRQPHDNCLAFALTSTTVRLVLMRCRRTPATFMPIAHRGNHFGKAVIAKGSIPRVVATGIWGRDEAEIRSRLEAWNQPIHRIRGRIEKIFGTWKRSYGLRRMR